MIEVGSLLLYQVFENDDIFSFGNSDSKQKVVETENVSGSSLKKTSS